MAGKEWTSEEENTLLWVVAFIYIKKRFPLPLPPKIPRSKLKDIESDFKLRGGDKSRSIGAIEEKYKRLWKKNQPKRKNTDVLVFIPIARVFKKKQKGLLGGRFFTFTQVDDKWISGRYYFHIKDTKLIIGKGYPVQENDPNI